MSQSPSTSPEAVPRWLVIVGSAFILLHLFAVVIVVLAAPSGPWASMQGMSYPEQPPQFALAINQRTAPYYLDPLRLAYNFHYMSNNPTMLGARLEMRLLDETGKQVAVVRLPDENVNFWVRHRQRLLAEKLATMDVPPFQLTQEKVYPDDSKPPEVHFWDEQSNFNMALVSRPENLAPRDRPLSHPSSMAMLMVNSFARHLCRKYKDQGVVRVKLIRQTQSPIPPQVLWDQSIPSMVFDTQNWNFGALPR
ncbi:MAG: hypothetical protein ACK4RK_13480 [Gemmataceae bacterium]